MTQPLLVSDGYAVKLGDAVHPVGSGQAYLVLKVLRRASVSTVRCALCVVLAHGERASQRRERWVWEI